MRRLLVPFVALLLLLSGCDQQAFFDRFTPEEESKIAKQVIAQVAARDFASVESLIDPALRTPDLRAKLEQMAAMVPPGAPKNVFTVGAETGKNSFSSTTTYNLTFEYEYANAWLVANTVLERHDGKLTLQGIHFVPRMQSLAKENAFTYSGKGALQYVIFALAIAIVLLVLFALVVCIRTPIARRKWLWIIFVLFGVVEFQLNWTTGQWAIQPISFLLFGAGIFKAGPFAPWVVHLAFPLGAIVFLAGRKSFARPKAKVADAEKSDDD